MDPGFGNLLDDATKREVLERTRAELGGRMFAAGAFVKDAPGSAFCSPTAPPQAASNTGTSKVGTSFCKDAYRDVGLVTCTVSNLCFCRSGLGTDLMGTACYSCRYSCIYAQFYNQSYLRAA